MGEVQTVSTYWVTGPLASPDPFRGGVAVDMDSCDFSLGNYCAVEKGDDPDFTDFNLQRDAQYVQPLIFEASKALGRPVPLLLSPQRI